MIFIGNPRHLGFEWKGDYFVFTVLPFGLATACYVFTKVLRPLVKYWRMQGMRLVLYLDDGIGMSRNRDCNVLCSKVVRATLENAGFVTQPEKCAWEPSQSGAWLGYELDLVRGIISIPQKKINKLLQLLTTARGVDRLPARVIASIVGQIIAMNIDIGPGADSELEACIHCLTPENLGLMS